MAAYALVIDDTNYTDLAEDRFHISAPQNGPATLDLTLWGDSVGELAAVTFDQEVVITENGVPIFGGNIIRPRIEGIAGKTTIGVQLSITANDFNKLASRTHIGIESGHVDAGTLKHALESIVTWIPDVTLAPDQVDGPTIEAYDQFVLTPQEALDYLTQVTGYIWRIEFELSIIPDDPFTIRTLRMFEPGSLAAPFDIDEGTFGGVVVEGDVTVELKRDDYANRLLVFGNGVTKILQDDDAVDDFGPWELVVNAPDITTQEALDALATSMLAAHLVTLKEVRYLTLLTGIEPGMTQTITLPSRGISDTFLVTEVNTDYSGGLARRTVTAIEGTVYRNGWRENTKAWIGGGGTTVSGSGGSGGSVSTTTRYAYPLGGSASDFVSSPVPTWVDAAPNAVQISTVARGTTSATIVAQLRALTPGVSVQARLFDLSEGPSGAAVPGVSAVVTNTEWQTVTWTVTLNPGSHYVRLQLLPGTANEGVSAVGYLE